MPRRSVLLIVFAVLASALFIRLGVWQIDRLHQRRARNAEVLRGLDAPPVDVHSLPRDTTAAFHRASVTGVPDYAHQLTVISRSHDGAPGVYLLTPVRVAGSDTAVLVNRGFVYAPDGATVDAAKWAEGDSARAWSGFVARFESGRGTGALPGKPTLLTRMDSAAAARVLPYPVLPFVLVQMEPDSVRKRRELDPRTPVATTPARLEPPPLDEGPHLSYAIQWFSFALIALVGTAFVTARSMQKEQQNLDLTNRPPRAAGE